MLIASESKHTKLTLAGTVIQTPLLRERHPFKIEGYK